MIAEGAFIRRSRAEKVNRDHVVPLPISGRVPLMSISENQRSFEMGTANAR